MHDPSAACRCTAIPIFLVIPAAPFPCLLASLFLRSFSDSSSFSYSSPSSLFPCFLPFYFSCHLYYFICFQLLSPFPTFLFSFFFVFFFLSIFLILCFYRFPLSCNLYYLIVSRLPRPSRLQLSPSSAILSSYYSSSSSVFDCSPFLYLLPFASSSSPSSPFPSPSFTLLVGSYFISSSFLPRHRSHFLTLCI